MKILKYISNISAGIWVFSGFIIIGSIYHSTIGIFSNIFIGILFVFIGLFIYWKEENLLHILNVHKGIKEIGKVIFAEYVIIIVSLLIGLIALSAVVSRVFLEGLAVFG